MIGAILIAGVSLAAYFPSLKGGFIFDDEVLVSKNDLMKSSDGLRAIWFSTRPYEYYPISYTSFWIEWRLWRTNPLGYRITNLLLHVFACLLLWAALRKLAVPGSFLAALLFAVHPVNVESVAWIAQLRNMLALVFFLLSILWYVRADDWAATQEKDKGKRGEVEARRTAGSSGIWYWLSLLAFIAAMLSKGSVAILPAVLLGIAWWKRGLVRRSVWFEIIPFAVVAVAFTAVNIWFQTHRAHQAIRNATFDQRITGAGAIVWFYLAKAVLPIDLLFFYNQWRIDCAQLRWWLPLATAIALTLVLVATQKRNRYGRSLLLAWGFFCIALVPVLGLTDTGYMQFSLVADHYQHIALIGVVSLAAAMWDWWYRNSQGVNRKTSVVAAAAVAGLLVTQTIRQNRLYGDPIALFEATVRQNPDLWLAHNNLGRALANAGRTSEAIAELNEALRLNSQSADVHDELGSVFRQQGKLPEAIDQYQTGLTIDPASAATCNDLGNAYKQAGQIGQAEEMYRRALQLKPEFPEAHNNLGTLLAKSGKYAEAIEHYQMALLLWPDFSEAHYNLGNALIKAGRPLESVEQFESVLRRKPDDLEAAVNLMSALAEAGRTAQAIAAADKALELARSQGNTELVQQIEAWLAKVRPLPENVAR